MKAKAGGCAVCGHDGHPMTAPPLSRCQDMKACDARRIRNAAPNTVIEWAGPVKLAVMRRNRAHYFRREFHYDQMGQVIPKSEHLVLVPDVKEGTRFTSHEARVIIREWGAKIVEAA